MRQVMIRRNGRRTIVVAPSPPTMDSFRAKAGVVPGTYACDLVDRFNEYICGSAVDLRQEYEGYYRAEYTTIAGFLYHKHALSAREVRALEPFIESGLYLGLVRHTRARDYQMSSFIQYCETGFAAMMEAMGLQWVEGYDED